MTEIILIIIILGIALWFARTILSGFLIVVGVFILAWLLWYTTGGVERFEDSNQGMFIRPSKDYKSFETYGSFPEFPTGTSTQR